MTLSVRMDPMLEQQLEAAAKRQGMTKSQFIVEAVQRALGQKDAYRTLMDVQQAYGLPRAGGEPTVMQDGPNSGTAARAAPIAPGGPAWRTDLHARQSAAMADWLAYQAAKKAGQPWAPEAPAPAARPKRSAAPTAGRARAAKKRG